MTKFITTYTTIITNIGVITTPATDIREHIREISEIIMQISNEVGITLDGKKFEFAVTKGDIISFKKANKRKHLMEGFFHFEGNKCYIVCFTGQNLPVHFNAHYILYTHKEVIVASEKNLHTALIIFNHALEKGVHYSILKCNDKEILHQLSSVKHNRPAFVRKNKNRFTSLGGGIYDGTITPKW